MTHPISQDDPFTIATKHWHRLGDGRIQCDVCPRACKLHEGQRGLCFVRGRIDDQVKLTSYGRSSGFCVDPVEKKPLNHFLPGSAVLSFGTAGCNLACKFCQNWDISKSREIDTLASRAGPDDISRTADELGCRSVAFTYNDPTIFWEYAADVADACHDRGIKAIAVTAGYICSEPRAEFYRHIDAANVDLKAFTEDFYRKVCVGHLHDVLDTLVYLRHETDVWLEITTLLIPGRNGKRRRNRRRMRVDPGEPGHRRTGALHRIPSRLQDARHTADTSCHPEAGPLYRHRGRPTVRLHRQRSRRRGRQHLLPRVRVGGRGSRLVRDAALCPD
jgi:pyruvate formate lyase activating enzyme